MGHHNIKFLSIPIGLFVYIVSIMGSSMKHAAPIMFSPWIKYAVPGTLTLIICVYFIFKQKIFRQITLVPVAITLIMLLYFGYRLLFGYMYGGVTPVILFCLPFIGYLLFYYYEYIYYDYK